MTRNQLLTSARAALSAGRPDVAETMLRTLLSDDRLDAEALFLFSNSLAALGRSDEAAAGFARLLAHEPDDVRAAVPLGVMYVNLGKHHVALKILDAAKAINAHAAGLDFAVGLCQLGLEQLPEAEASFRRAVARDPHVSDIHNNLGATLVRLGRFPEAIECFRRALDLAPSFATARRNLGDALSLAGAAHREASQFEKAAAAYAGALELDAGHRAALLGLGLLATAHDDAEAAARWLAAAWQQQPAEIWVALAAAAALDRAGLRSEALQVYERTLELEPDNVDLQEAQGQLLHRLGRLDEALACYERASSGDPKRRSLQLNLGHVQESLGDLEAGTARFRGVLAEAPSDRSALAGAASCAFRSCDWDAADTMTQQLLQLPGGIADLHPFLRLALNIDPAVLAESYRRDSLAIGMRTPHSVLTAYSHDRLRVAYISPDFRQHPVAYALAGMIREHDRRQIEPIGVSLTVPDQSDIAVQLKASFETFIDCSAMTDRHIVQTLREREIDLAVDLAGFTSGARNAIFAARVAPTQVNFLGFPCTTGAAFMDGIIADNIVIPAGDERLYAERVVRLPHAYLPFDRSRPIAAEAASRERHGLPSRGFVFCGFTNGYKLSREVFGVWMALLRQVPESVLWLRGGHPALQSNLAQAARAGGVDADRLVYSARIGRMDEHFARLRLVDLFLDTTPYNAHTTTAEALWAGVPVVTCRGRTFAGRVGASLLAAAGLSELVADSLESYRELALRLARSPDELAAVRGRLRDVRDTAPIFDTVAYVRGFEQALHELRKPA